MIIEDFKDALDELGIEYKETGRSIVLKECPACGSSKYKVLLKKNEESDGPLLGKCLRGSCEEGYSSIKYLIMMGVDRADALRIHGLDIQKTLDSIHDTEKAPLLKDIIPAKKDIIDVDIKDFIGLDSWPSHPANKYAIKRGAIPGKDIMIDPRQNAVVFLVRRENHIIGWQKRFLVEPKPGMKTQTSPGFEKSKHVLEYPGSGSILVCEGPFTALSANAYGFHSICTFGNGISEEQINIIIDKAVTLKKKIGIAAEVKDGIQDDANTAMMNKLRNALFWREMKLFKVFPEEGKDLNDSWMAGKKYTIENDNRWLGPAVPELKMF